MNLLTFTETTGLAFRAWGLPRHCPFTSSPGSWQVAFTLQVMSALQAALGSQESRTNAAELSDDAGPQGNPGDTDQPQEPGPQDRGALVPRL